MADKKDKKKQKRIKGKAYWKLNGFMNEIKQKQKDLAKWQLEKAEEQDLYPDQIAWGSGAIYDPLAEIVEGKVINGKTIKRLPREIFKEYLDKIKEIDDVDVEVTKYREELAEKLGIWPDMIAYATGKITGEYDGIEPVEKKEEDPIGGLPIIAEKKKDPITGLPVIVEKKETEEKVPGFKKG